MKFGTVKVFMEEEWNIWDMKTKKPLVYMIPPSDLLSTKRYNRNAAIDIQTINWQTFMRPVNHICITSKRHLRVWRLLCWRIRHYTTRLLKSTLDTIDQSKMLPQLKYAPKSTTVISKIGVSARPGVRHSLLWCDQPQLLLTLLFYNQHWNLTDIGIKSS